MSQNNPSNLRRTVWIPTWGTFGALGLCDKIDPALKIVRDPIKTGTTGKITIGSRVIAVEGTIKITVREVNQAIILALAPWNGGTLPSGGIALIPPLNTDLYQYAATLRLHPFDRSDNEEDLVLTQALPITPLNSERAGLKDEEWTVEFEIYPNRASMATTPTTAPYGTSGGA